MPQTATCGLARIGLPRLTWRGTWIPTRESGRIERLKRSSGTPVSVHTKGYTVGRIRGIPGIRRIEYLQLCEDCETVRKGDDLVVCAVHNEHRVPDLVHLSTDVPTHVRCRLRLTTPTALVMYGQRDISRPTNRLLYLRTTHKPSYLLHRSAALSYERNGTGAHLPNVGRKHVVEEDARCRRKEHTRAARQRAVR